jgi:hypothetical protein
MNLQQGITMCKIIAVIIGIGVPVIPIKTLYGG